MLLGVARTVLESPIVTRRRHSLVLAFTLVASAASVFAIAKLGARRAAVAPSVEVTRADETRAASASATLVADAPRARTNVAAAAKDAAAANGEALAALKKGLAAEDEATRIAAVEAAESETAIETLPELEKFVLKNDPETAPTVIHAVAVLGASADDKTRDEAARTLAGWLRDERKRQGPDVPGNVSNLVEALGEVGGQDAVDALTAMLDHGDLPLHVQTLAVQELGDLADGRARGPVERFEARVQALPPSDGIDEELRTEAIAAAKATLSRI